MAPRGDRSVPGAPAGGRLGAGDHRAAGFDGTRAGLAELARQTRVSEFCHLVVAALGGVAVAIAALCGDLPAVLWLGGTTVAFHLHPVLLQRALRARIVRLMTVKHY